MCLFSLLFYFVINKIVNYDTDTNLISTSELIINSIQSNRNIKNLKNIKDEMEELIPSDLYVEIINEKGESIYTNEDIPIFNKIDKEELKKFYFGKQAFKNLDNMRVMLSTFYFRGEKNILIVGNDSNYLQNIIRNSTILFFVIIVIIFGIYIILSINMINKILDAIKKITATAQIIEKDKLSHRIENIYNTKEIDKLIDTLNKMFDRIEIQFKNISQFSSDVSHELKTPLSAIKNMIEVELIRSHSADEYKEVMIRILEEVDWMSQIINDLLFMSRIEVGKEEIRYEEIDLYENLNDLVEILEVLAEEKGIKLELNVKKGQVLHGDKNKIRRMLMNVITNSIKYNKKNGKVFINVIEKEENILFLIEDTGIGIKAENLPKVFERFYREDKTRMSKVSGSGLGLSIVDAIVKLHNGKVEIESEEGNWTRVKIALPKNINNLNI